MRTQTGQYDGGSVLSSYERTVNFSAGFEIPKCRERQLRLCEGTFRFLLISGEAVSLAQRASSNSQTDAYAAALGARRAVKKDGGRPSRRATADVCLEVNNRCSVVRQTAWGSIRRATDSEYHGGGVLRTYEPTMKIEKLARKV